MVSNLFILYNLLKVLLFYINYHQIKLFVILVNFHNQYFKLIHYSYNKNLLNYYIQNEIIL